MKTSGEIAAISSSCGGGSQRHCRELHGHPSLVEGSYLSLLIRPSGLVYRTCSDLHLLTFAKTLCTNKVTPPGTKGWDSNSSLSGMMFSNRQFMDIWDR